MIRRALLILALILPSAASALENAEAPPDIYVEGNILYLTEPGGQSRALATSQTGIGGISLSPDGKLIAFHDFGPEENGGFLRVVDRNGKPVGKTIDLAREGVPCGDCWMGGWVDNRTFQFVAHQNPDLDATFLVDVRTSRVINSIYSAGGFALSTPHYLVANVEDIPHWAPSDKVLFGSLTINGSIVTALKDKAVQFTTSPAWSPDERFVAITGIVGRDYAPRLFIIDASSLRVRSVYMLQQTEDIYDLKNIVWDGSGLTVSSNAYIWKINPDNRTPPARIPASEKTG